MTEEIDRKGLKEEVSQIKESMGLYSEDNPLDAGSWLMWGLLVGIASLVSQVVLSYRMPGYFYSIIWFGSMFGIGFPIQIWRSKKGTGEKSFTTSNKPNFGVLWLAVFAGGGVIIANMFKMIDVSGLSYTTVTAYIASSILGLVGIAYLLMGNDLRSYYIRRRDRWTFYIGGLWILIFSFLIPTFSELHEWVYLIYGILYVTHSLGSYLYLREG